jgi:hypothetical protein
MALKESTPKREAYFLQWAQNISDELGEHSKLKMFFVGGLRKTDGMLVL